MSHRRLVRLLARLTAGALLGVAGGYLVALVRVPPAEPSYADRLARQGG